MWYIYILRCQDNSFYTGITENLEERVKRHNNGKGSLYTKRRRPLTLVYSEICAERNKALHREIEIKKLSKINKGKLIKG